LINQEFEAFVARTAPIIMRAPLFPNEFISRNSFFTTYGDLMRAFTDVCKPYVGYSSICLN